MNTVLVYTPNSSKRLTYVLDYFSRTLELDFRTTDDLEKFRNAATLRINYSAVPIDQIPQIVPHTLLFENDVREQTTECSEWHSLPCFFCNTNGDVPFDIFAATFYLITRYEEYVCKQKDQHGRFPHTESLAFKNGFLQRPIVDLWAFELLKIVAPQHQIKRQFGLLPTIDIDNFYKYRRKGILGSTLLFFRDLCKGNFEEIKHRTKTLLHRTDDPFFNFEQLAALHKTYPETRFFFHVGGRGRFDKRVLFPNFSKRYHSVIKTFNQKFNVGIHPSYKAAFSPKRFAKEQQRLARLTGENPHECRFHFLRFRLPASYRMLAENGITDDYSMLFANEIGFRAGTSLPYPFFDLERNEQLSLTIHPTAIMDTTFLKKTPAEREQLFAATQQMLADVHRTHSTFVTLFHNEHLTDQEQNQTMVNFYKSLLKTGKNQRDENL